MVMYERAPRNTPINVSNAICYRTPHLGLCEEPASGAPDGFAVIYQHIPYIQGHLHYISVL
jgi:hypothetical protein